MKEKGRKCIKRGKYEGLGGHGIATGVAILATYTEIVKSPAH